MSTPPEAGLQPRIGDAYRLGGLDGHRPVEREKVLGATVVASAWAGSRPVSGREPADPVLNTEGWQE